MLHGCKTKSGSGLGARLLGGGGAHFQEHSAFFLPKRLLQVGMLECAQIFVIGYHTFDPFGHFPL